MKTDPSNNDRSDGSRLILVTGGARSGKSSFAEAMADAVRRDGVTCIVTLDADRNDPEMQARITAHRARRPADWRVIEAPTDLAGALADAGDTTVLIDCLTLWLANRIETLPEHLDRDHVAALVHEWLPAAAARDAPTIVVTNELGSGLVPMHPLGRRFRDAAGWANQLVADRADEVWSLVAGQPLRIKPNEDVPSWWTKRTR